MENIENNKLIAEFLNVTKNLHLYEHPITGEYVDLESIDFESDWNLLMIIVEKIESLLPDDSVVTIEHKSCWIPIYDDEQHFGIEGRGETKKIQAVYYACVEFVKWYNQQNK